MNRTTLISVAEMNTMIASQKGDLAEIETTLQQKLGTGTGTAAAQSKRLVAFALAKQAAAMLEQAASSVEYLNVPADSSSEETAPETDDTGLLGGLVKMAAEIAVAIAESLGVDAEAIPPFLIESNSIMLPLSGDMINQAKEKLVEADVAESQGSAS